MPLLCSKHTTPHLFTTCKLKSKRLTRDHRVAQDLATFLQPLPLSCYFTCQALLPFPKFVKLVLNYVPLYLPFPIQECSCYRSLHRTSCHLFTLKCLILSSISENHPLCCCPPVSRTCCLYTLLYFLYS